MFKKTLWILLLSFSAYATDLKIVTPESFLAENPSEERKNIVEFLVNQFNGKSVSKSEIESLWQDDKASTILKTARFQIVNQKLYADSFNLGHYYFPILLEYFQKLLKNYKINDVDFIIYLREEIPREKLTEKSFKTPIFMMFQNLNYNYETAKLLFPDGRFLGDSWHKLLTSINKSISEYPWQTKIEKFFWRGGGTGNVPYNVNNFSKLDRLKLVIFSKLYPDIIDASFAGYFEQTSDDQSGKDLKLILELLTKLDTSSVSEIKHLQYKYLLSVDGNAATGTRVPWIMFSNSVLIKQESKNIQWYYSALKPYVHYVPLKNDLTDIFNQYEWLKTHDQEIQQISQNAHNFIQNNLLPEHIDSHVVILLNEYSKIQQNKQIIPSLPPAEETLNLTHLIKNLFRYIKVKFLCF